MKKNVLRAFALSALLLAGASGMQAQEKTYEVPPMNPEYQTEVEKVIKLSMDDPDAANKIYMKLERKIANSKEDLVSIGTYFLDNNNYPAAKRCADRVYQIAPEYIPGLMFSGEVCMKRKDWGGAGQKFDAVLLADSNNVNALKRNAFVYRNVNPIVALETLTRIKKLEPTYYEADRIMGDIYYKDNKYKKAIESYDVYYKETPKDKDLNIRSCENYVQSLFSMSAAEPENNKKITSIVSEVLPLDPKDMVLHRMDFFAKMGILGEAMDYDGALKAAEEASAYITNGEFSDSLLLSLDYEYAAMLAREKGDKALAVSYFEKALAKDPEKVVNYKELAKYYRQNKQFDKAVATYNTYMEKKGEKVDAVDYFGLGQEYLMAARNTTDEALKQQYIAGGDAAYNKVLEKKPDFYRALMQQAVLHITDQSKPEDAPKEYYEKALALMEGEDDSANSSRLLAAQYIAFYYAQKDDFDTCRKYVNIMLKADPENEQAKSFDSSLKSMGK